ncbi:small multi-drug export protein [Salicibibacter kimchii]|uniref:small multi-drug export protein n=1 Tax=Salicibibacter kimchii TaxID=2099786 RepID=UPI001D04F0F6|nr:small multi-drug export protein [Salicibibacter kimchii]
MVGALVGLPIISAALTGMLGNWISVMLIILLFNALLMRFRDRTSKNDGFIQNRVSKSRERYEKYGVPGVAILAPLVASGHIAAFASLAAGADKKRVIVWHTVSIGIWGVLGGLFGDYLHYEIMQ